MAPRALLSFLLTLLLGLGLLQAADPATIDPRASAIAAGLQQEGVRLLVLGNSVTQSAIDPPGLARALHLPADAVASLASEGAGPGAWVATFERAQAAGWTPQVLLLYVPFDMIWTPNPASDADIALLADLDASPAAFALAGQPDQGLGVYLTQRRLQLQRSLLSALTVGLVDRLWPVPPGARPASARARAAVFGEGGPNDPTAQAPRLAPAKPPTTGDPNPAVAAALIAMAQQFGARLVVVQPAENPGKTHPTCGPQEHHPKLEALLAVPGVDRIDLATALPDPNLFRTHHHLGEDGRAPLNAILAKGLSSLDVLETPANAPARRWTAPCP